MISFILPGNDDCSQVPMIMPRTMEFRKLTITLLPERSDGIELPWLLKEYSNILYRGQLMAIFKNIEKKYKKCKL